MGELTQKEQKRKEKEQNSFYEKRSGSIKRLSGHGYQKAFLIIRCEVLQGIERLSQAGCLLVVSRSVSDVGARVSGAVLSGRVPVPSIMPIRDRGSCFSPLPVRQFITHPMVRCLIVTDSRGVPPARRGSSGHVLPDSPQSLIACSVNTQKAFSLRQRHKTEQNRAGSRVTGRAHTQRTAEQVAGCRSPGVNNLSPAKRDGRHTTSVGEDVSNSLLSAGVQRASNNMML